MIKIAYHIDNSDDEQIFTEYSMGVPRKGDSVQVAGKLREVLHVRWVKGSVNILIPEITVA